MGTQSGLCVLAKFALVKNALVNKALVKNALVNKALVKNALVNKALVKNALVKHALAKQGLFLAQFWRNFEAHSPIHDQSRILPGTVCSTGPHEDIPITIMSSTNKSAGKVCMATKFQGPPKGSSRGDQDLASSGVCLCARSMEQTEVTWHQ